MLCKKNYSLLKILVALRWILPSVAYVKSGSGTFRLNGIFSITNPNKINYQSGVLMAEAMKYAVEKINNDTNYLYGYKIGIEKMFDLKKEKKVRKSVLSTFMGDIPFLIGPYSSESSYITSILTGTFRQVVISYGATNIDFDDYGLSFGYMLRTVPSDTFRVQAVSDIIEKLGWNYVALINSNGYNGEKDARYLVQKFDRINVCLSEQIDLPRYSVENNYIEAIKQLHDDRRLKAVILYTINDDSRRIFQAIKTLNLGDRFYILCVFGCTNYIEVVQGMETIASGTMSIDLNYKEVKDFKKYFLKQTPNINTAKYFRKFWQEFFNCSLYNDLVTYPQICTGKERLTEGHGYYPLTPVYTVIDAVYAVAKTIRGLIEYYCHADKLQVQNETRCSIDAYDPKRFSHTAFKMLVNMSYIDGTLNNLQSWLHETNNYVQYDLHNFNFVHERVSRNLIGTWKIKRTGLDDNANTVLKKEKAVLFLKNDSLIFQKGRFIKPHAVCSQPCPPAFIKVRDINPLRAKCCWKCEKCPENSISKNNTCHQCQHVEMLSYDKTKCQKLPQNHINISSNPFAVIVLLLACSGVCCVAIVTLIFIYFNNNRVVRSSGRDLCFVILIGIAIIFTCPFVFVSRPTTVVCVLRGVLPGVGFLTCYAPLFLKTNRIYRIFLNAKKSVTRPALISPQSQLLVLLGIISVQLLLCCVWFVSKKPGPYFVLNPSNLYLTVHCKRAVSPVAMVLNLTLSVMFMICCTIFAFKTRHFPKNYNEAKYIGITLYITCVAWAVFLPAYFLTNNSKYDFMREYLTCTICILVGYITLAGLFGQKVKILLSERKDKKKEPQMLTIKGPTSHATCQSLLEENERVKTKTLESPGSSSLSDQSNI